MRVCAGMRGCMLVAMCVGVRVCVLVAVYVGVYAGGCVCGCICAAELALTSPRFPHFAPGSLGPTQAQPEQREYSLGSRKLESGG